MLFHSRSIGVAVPEACHILLCVDSWWFLAIYSPEHDDYPFLSMTKLALPIFEAENPT
jgi:hypothetical protein